MLLLAVLKGIDQLRLRELARQYGMRGRLLQLVVELAHIDHVSMLGEMAPSLAHVIKQPSAAAVSSANSCNEWLAHDPPNVDRARAAAARIDTVIFRTRGRRVFVLATLLLIAPPLALALDPDRRISQYGHTVWRIQDGAIAPPTKFGFDSGPHYVLDLREMNVPLQISSLVSLLVRDKNYCNESVFEPRNRLHLSVITNVKTFGEIPIAPMPLSSGNSAPRSRKQRMRLAIRALDKQRENKGPVTLIRCKFVGGVCSIVSPANDKTKPFLVTKTDTANKTPQGCCHRNSVGQPLRFEPSLEKEPE